QLSRFAGDARQTRAHRERSRHAHPGARSLRHARSALPRDAHPGTRGGGRVARSPPSSSPPGLTRWSILASNMKSFWVYILASRPRGTLYVGMTNDLVRRVYEHREGLADGFTKEFGVKSLLYYEQHATAIGAIQREKNIKHWSRKWKIDLIRSMNADWRDLWEDVTRLTRTAVICYLSAWTTVSSPVVTKGWGRRSCRLRIALRRGHLVCRDPRGLGQ